MAGQVFSWDSQNNPDLISKNLLTLEKKTAVAILMYCKTKAAQLEASMKLNRPWTDRTSMAKTTLNTSVSQPDINTVRITLAHGVDYGIWLELAHERNYAIIEPTLNQEGPKVMDGLQGILDGVKL
jgi:hypothetical protein